MARNKKLTEERNRKLIAHYEELANKGWRHQQIMEELEIRFFVRPRTIYSILSKTTEPSN